MRHMLFLSLLLLGATWAMAQNDQNPTPQDTAPTTTTSGQMSSPMSADAGSTSVQGCLSGSDGNYTLTDKDGNAYQLSGDTSKLTAHVGHEIKVTGSTGSNAGATAASGNGASKQLQVTSFKHVAKTCSNSGTMSH